MMSFGYKGCQSSLNQGVKVVKLNLLRSIQQVISAFLEYLLTKNDFFLSVCFRLGDLMY